MECCDERNVFGGHYHVREPESQRLEMSLQEFMQCAQSWQTRQLYLRVPPSANSPSSGPARLQSTCCDKDHRKQASVGMAQS